MLKRFITLNLLLSMYIATQCAEHSTTPDLTPGQAAICRHYICYNPENWDTLSSSLSKNLITRYTDITKKELVGFFRWRDEQGRGRASVVPLPMLQRIWGFIKSFKLVKTLNLCKSCIILPEASASYPLSNTLSRSLFNNWLSLTNYIKFTHSSDLLRLKKYHATDISMDNIFECDLYTQKHAHIILTDKNAVLVIPHITHISYVPDSDQLPLVSTETLITALNHAVENGNFISFANYEDAFAYLNISDER